MGKLTFQNLFINAMCEMIYVPYLRMTMHDLEEEEIKFLAHIVLLRS